MVSKCLNGVKNMEGIDYEVIEGFDDIEDDRVTTLVDGFNGVDVTVPINHRDTVAGLLGRLKKKIENDEYYSDELDISDPNESVDDKGSKFERFRKKHLNIEYKFKWGMKFNYLVDFREAICVWCEREITFVKNESYKVRIECKAKYGILVLCSKVGHDGTMSLHIFYRKNKEKQVKDDQI